MFFQNGRAIIQRGNRSPAAPEGGLVILPASVIMPTIVRSVVRWIEHHPGALIFLAMCLVAVFTFTEYGLGWDEPLQRRKGIVTYNYISSGDPELFNFYDRDFGVALEVPLVIMERVLGLTDTRDIYLMRHAVGHLIFLLGAIFCFKLTVLLYRSKPLAILAFLLFVTHPVLYGHSFFNTKDIPFMSAFMACLYLSALAFRDYSTKSFLILGMAAGLLINLRVMGIMLPVVVIMIMFCRAIVHRRYLDFLKLSSILILSSAAVLYVTWPFLWTDPINRFGFVLKSMAHIRWDLTVLLNGRFVQSTALPWYYTPLWFCITTPILWLIAGFAGTVALIINSIKKRWDYLTTYSGMTNMLCLVCFYLPLLVVILLHSVLYDGWRHMFFIYPGFVMLIVTAVHAIRIRITRAWLVPALFLTFLPVVLFSVRNFPNQHVFFNSFLSRREPEYIRKHFELDYWAVSSRQALERIADLDPSPLISICAEKQLGAHGLAILPAKDRDRFHVTDSSQADYFLTNYRWHPQDHEELRSATIHTIVVGRTTIYEVFKLK
jgi:hypothetical protein